MSWQIVLSQVSLWQTQRACPGLFLSVVDIQCILFALSDIHFKFAGEYIYRYIFIFFYIFIFNVNDRWILVVFNKIIIHMVRTVFLQFPSVFYFLQFSIISKIYYKNKEAPNQIIIKAQLDSIEWIRKFSEKLCRSGFGAFFGKERLIFLWPF